MKILLVNHQDSTNINAFSGTSYFMSKAIKKTFEDVVEYNDFESNSIVKDVLSGHLKKTLKPIGRKLTTFIKNNNVNADFVICQGGNSSIPFYNSSIPIVFWHDSTWSSYLTGYRSKKEFRSFKNKYTQLYLWDKMAMERADLLIFSSSHVAESTIENYKIHERKVKVVPFGANLHTAPDREFLSNSLILKRKTNQLNLTFIGKDWERKGLLIAYHLTKKLNSQGFNTKLNVIGCQPDVEYIKKSPYVNVLGFLNKNNADDSFLFRKMLEETHFLVHPASYEPFGIVLCEANANGIPVLACNVEGPSYIIKNGTNGFLFNKRNFTEEASKIIKYIISDFEKSYTNLFNSSIAEYKSRLNWESNTKTVRNILAMI